MDYMSKKLLTNFKTYVSSLLFNKLEKALIDLGFNKDTTEESKKIINTILGGFLDKYFLYVENNCWFCYKTYPLNSIFIDNKTGTLCTRPKTSIEQSMYLSDIIKIIEHLKGKDSLTINLYEKLNYNLESILPFDKFIYHMLDRDRIEMKHSHLIQFLCKSGIIYIDIPDFYIILDYPFPENVSIENDINLYADFE